MSEKHHVLMPLAEGFEEIEAVTIIDVLRRADLRVTTAGLRPGPVRGAHGIGVEADASLSALNTDSMTVLVLPGGMPGTTNLMEDERVLELVRKFHASGRLTTAICAAPMVLAAAGVEEGHTLTAYPGARGNLGSAEVVDAPRVVRSGNVITSQGPGSAMEFALALVEELVGAERAAELSEAMLVEPPAAVGG